MKIRIRTLEGGYMTTKNAAREVKRGHARWVGDRLEIIKSDRGHMPCFSPVRAAPTAAVVVPFVSIGDSGQSIFPHIGYDRRSKGAGRQHIR